MAITQLSQSIVLRGLALLGARTDAPTIVRITDSCGKVIETAPARAPTKGGFWNDFQPCLRGGSEARIAVEATAPSGQVTTLLVNGAEARSIMSSSALVRFEAIRLRPGRNLLAVGSGPAALAALRSRDVRIASRQTDYGLLPDIEVGAPIQVQTPNPGIQPRVVGQWQSALGRWLLIQGPPNTYAEVPGIQEGAYLGADGFTVVSIANPLPQVPELDATQFRRTASFVRDNAGNTRATVEACLPKDNILAQWALTRDLSPRDFITRLTGVEFMFWPDRVVPPRDDLSVSQTATCHVVRARMIFPGWALYRYGGSFLETPFDELRLEGFGERLISNEPPADKLAGDKLVFRGGAGGPDRRLSISPDVDQLTTELNQRPVQASQPRPTPSRFAAAWARAEAGFPVWFRTLLSGIAVVAPIILLVVVIGRLNLKTAPAIRPNTLAGLYALLLLALAVAAQPLLFQLFYQTADLAGIQDFLVEHRADQGRSFFDPYAPIALAVALMLVPSLHSAKRTSERRSSVWLAVACALASAAGVVILIAAVLFEILPWRTADPDTRLLEWLVTFNPSAEYVWPIVAGAIAAGIGFAWIPIYWAFRAMMPGGRFLWASLFAGTAAIILPPSSYLVEAARISLSGPPAADSGGDTSWISLLGSTLLPFLLFFVLLRAFREILATVLPPAPGSVIQSYGRNRNLLLAAALLTLPRMTADAANPSPADMGIVNILGSFQTFGLVVAMLAAAALLAAYGERRARDGRLAPFRLGADEMLVLSALFAGYATLWTAGPLATAVAVAAGLFAFNKLVVEPATELPPALADHASARALIAFHEESALLAARRKALEARFAKAEDDYATLTRGREALAQIEAAKQAELHVHPGEVKRRLLEFGPGVTPLANSIRGAVTGLVFATMVQLASSIRGSGIEGPLKIWTDLLTGAMLGHLPSETASVAPPSPVAVLEMRQVFSPDIMLFLGTLVSAYFEWILLGFLFGFTFHRIRGDDGFVKALVFGGGVAVAFLLSALFSVSPDGVQPMRIVPVFMFLLLVGVLVFDMRSLSSRGQSPTRLADVYGFRTSLGYVASIVGAATAFEPLLKALRGLIGKV